MNTYIAYDSLDEEGYLYRAKIHIKLLAYDEARADLMKGLRINPVHQQLLYQSAALSYLRDEYALAADYTSRALAENPDYAEAYNVRGLAYVKKGELSGLPKISMQQSKSGLSMPRHIITVPLLFTGWGIRPKPMLMCSKPKASALRSTKIYYHAYSRLCAKKGSIKIAAIIKDMRHCLIK